MRSNRLARCPVRFWLGLALLGSLMRLPSASAQEETRPGEYPWPLFVIDGPGRYDPDHMEAPAEEARGTGKRAVLARAEIARLKAGTRQAEARVKTASAACLSVAAKVKQAEANLRFAEADRKFRRIVLDHAEAESKAEAVEKIIVDEAKDRLAASEAAVDVARFGIDVAKAKLPEVDARKEGYEAERDLAQLFVAEATDPKAADDPAHVRQRSEAQFRLAGARLKTDEA